MYPVLKPVIFIAWFFATVYGIKWLKEWRIRNAYIWMPSPYGPGASSCCKALIRHPEFADDCPICGTSLTRFAAAFWQNAEEIRAMGRTPLMETKRYIGVRWRPDLRYN